MEGNGVGGITGVNDVSFVPQHLLGDRFFVTCVAYWLTEQLTWTVYW